MLGKTLIIQMSGKCESFSFDINHHEYIIPTTPSFSPTFLQRRDASCLKDQNILFLVFEYLSDSSLFEIGKSDASDGLMVRNSVKYDTIHSMLCEVERHNFKRLPTQAEYKFSSIIPDYIKISGKINVAVAAFHLHVYWQHSNWISLSLLLPLTLHPPF